MEPLKTTNGTVFSERRNLYTVSRNPGVRVYGERLVNVSGTEYREWNPTRSKLAAYLMCGGKSFPFSEDSKVLYLGAASGTTSSHVSDICRSGKVYCVEFSPRSFRDLVKTASGRDNMMPILGDATRPEEYAFMVENVDVVYADVAQKRQADILVDNMEKYCARYGMVSIKARSEDVTADPKDVFETSVKRLKQRGCRVLENVSLEPYEKSHAMIVVEKQRTAYCVAMKDGRFLMVHNPKRNGWEMPGGRIEQGETVEEAAKRECLEESGYDVTVVAKRNIGYCDVCACILGEKVSGCEMESQLFDELPEDLSFDTDEYEDVIAWARSCLTE
jgi:fibrillarin-like pre-rRNA processing protein